MSCEDVFLKVSKSHKLKFLVIYTYDLKSQPKSHAVRFVYLLKGRDGQPGLVKGFKGCFLAPGCFILPIANDREMQEVFNLWKIPFKRRLILTH